MNTNHTRLLASLLVVIGISLILASMAVAQEATPEATPDAAMDANAEVTAEATTDADADLGDENLDILDTDVQVAIEPTGDNGYCTICHSQPLRIERLEDGSILNLFVEPALITGSVHGPTEDSPGLGCLDCHGEDSFPHRGPLPESGRQYTLDSQALCTSCHEVQAEDLSMGLHAQAIEEGNLEAAVCTDCHNPHHVQSVENFPDLVAGVCGDCHDNTLQEWQMSPHVDIGPLGCASCHDYHAQTLRVGETTTALCVNCHQDMPDIFVHDSHLDGTEEGVPCADCHMYRDHDTQMISSLEADNTGHSMMVDTVPCTTCHADLIASGEWDDILMARFEIDAPSTTETTDDEAHDDEAAAEEEADDRFAGLQGLLLGLGLGVTFTIVFVTRSLRREQPERGTNDEQHE